MPRRRPLVASSFPTPPRRSHSGARSSPLDPAADVKVADRILFGKWSGTEVKIDAIEYLIMNESDIMGVLVEADAKKKAA
jgi:hypothetical protein